VYVQEREGGGREREREIEILYERESVCVYVCVYEIYSYLHVCTQAFAAWLFCSVLSLRICIDFSVSIYLV